MKELSIEQKAKSYDEALEKARQLCSYPTSKPFISDLQDLFPELKENDGNEDEKIRNNIKKVIGWYRGMFTEKSLMPEEYQEIDAWLEKQGERKHQYKSRPRYVGEGELLGKKESTEFSGGEKIRKPILDVEIPFSSRDSELEEVTYDIPKGYHAEIEDNKVVIKKGEQKPTKVEPKFKVDDWVVSKLDGKTRQISEVHCDEYNNYYIVKGNEYNIEEYDRLHLLWTIQDAKDGDVLVSESEVSLGTWYCIFKSLKDKDSMTVHCYISRNGDFVMKKELCFDKYPLGVNPATKEQRELLFAKMKEAGYEWDAEKKELKKIEQKPADWSEEDEEIISTLNAYAEVAENDDCPLNAEKIRKAIGKLKSLSPQSQWRPSEEEMKALEFCLEHNIDKDGVFGSKVVKLFEKLKKLTK